MADQKPTLVTVESIKWHTTHGKEYPVGATYDVDESMAHSLQAQGMAVRVDRAWRTRKPRTRPRPTARNDSRSR